MSEEKRNIPKLRFPGFTEAWEQRKLEEMVSFSKGSGYSKGDLKAEGTPIILYGRLYTKYETVITEIDTYVDARKVSVYSNGGEVIVPASGETAEDISIASVVEKPGVLLGGDLNIITPPEDLDSAFLAISISNGKPHSDMAKMAQGKSVVHLHNSDLGKIDLPYPSYDEQRLISGFFSSIDNLITLQQRKCDEIKNLKKCMLQKMFPKEGEQIPEIRFPGFTDAWEQRKLSDISSLITKGTTPLDKSGAGSINFIKVENIDVSSGIITPETKISEEEHNGYLKRSRLQENDILFSIAGTLGRVSVVESSILPANTNQALAIIRTKEGEISYLITALRGNVVADFIKRNPTVGAQPNLSLEQVSNLEIPYPSLKEQKQIGEFFDNLDNLITLHQRKLNQMKELKKSLLQQMFI